MIILKQIYLKNFLSHQDTSITLKEGEKILIDGISGSGKSSIIEALLWCLYGKGRVDNRSLIRRGAKETRVNVELLDKENGVTYEVVRTSSTSGKNTVVILKSIDGGIFEEMGTGGIRETDTYIAREILGASYQLFINSVVFPQGGVESFVTATSVRRKELLMEILHTADVEGLLDKTKEMIANKEAILIAEETILTSSKGIVEDNEEKIRELPRLLVKQETTQDLVQNTREILYAAENDLKEVEKTYNEVKEDEQLLKKIKGQIRFDTIKITEEDEKLLSEEDNIRTALTGAAEHNNKVQSAFSDKPIVRNYESEIEYIDQRIRKLVDETLPCPSGDACPYSKLVGPEIASLKEERKKKIFNLEQQEFGIKAWRSKVEALGPITDVSELVVKLNKIKDIKECQEQAKIIDQIKELEAKLASAPKLSDINISRNEVMQASCKLVEFERDLSETKGQIIYLTTLGKDNVRLKKDIKEGESYIKELKDQTSLLKDLREALGVNGITAIALDYMLPALEDKINEILSTLSDFKVTLTTQKNGIFGSSIEGLFILVHSGSCSDLDLNSLSGGEKIKIEVSISEALASLQKCNFRVMDEAITGLDSNMIDNFISVLSKIQDRYSQIINISHIQGIKDIYENKIIIKKIDGISYVA